MDSILKERLLDGLQDAVSNYNIGMDEEMAIAKSASDHGFNKAQTERLVELYNTSRTLHHFEHNANEKAAAFHLADKEAVLNLLFDSSNDKMASEFVEHIDPSADYGDPETDFYNCKSAEEFPFEQTFEKTANDIPDLDANAFRMERQLSKLRKEAEFLGDEARIESEMAHAALSKLAARISSYFDYGDTKKIASVVGLLADPKNVGVFESLSAYLPEHVLGCNVKLAHVIDDRTVREEADLIGQIVEHVGKSEQLLSKAEQRLETCKQASADFNKLILDYVDDGRSINAMDEFVSKQADLSGAALMTMALGGIPTYVSDIRKTPKAVDKEVEDANKRLINTHREMLLSDLVNNDPYLSEEDPKTIAGYYSHFAELSPELANNKEVVRSVLRQAVHNGGGGYSPFDAGSFLDAEKTLREVKGTLPPKQLFRELPGDDDKK